MKIIFMSFRVVEICKKISIVLQREVFTLNIIESRIQTPDFTYLPTYLRGCVPPLLEVALHVGSPSLSMLCIMSPCYTLQLFQVVSPSLTLPSSRSSALSWKPLGYSLCPSIIIQSGYMPRPFPLLFQYKLDYVLHSCSLSYFCVWDFIFYFQI